MRYLVWLTVIVISVQRLLELRLAARHRQWALARGAQEFGAAHYPLFFVLHTGWGISWVWEALRRGPHLSRGWLGWVGAFIAAQGLRYWAITSLGHLWHTRILIIPGERLVRRGPYRYLRHPNYLAVVLELASVPLIFGAWRTALVAGLLNAALLLGLRIPVEEAALARLEK